MSHQVKNVSKLSTLDAARSIYFIIVGLAIKQSLVLFGHSWPPQSVETIFAWWSLPDRLLVGAGYLFTTLRYTHGISSLYAYEKERIESSSLPSATRVFWLSVFLTSLGILFFLMADTIMASFRTYLLFTSMMLIMDGSYILLSGVVRSPFNIFMRWKETVNGYAARATLQWIVSDVILLITCLAFALMSADHERLFAFILVSAATTDYVMNREFYFGGRHERKKQKIVFICSPLKGFDNDGPIAERIKSNIRRVQWYCYQLMLVNQSSRKAVIPYASHCFLTYFLDDGKAADRIIGRDCAIAYLSACDAIYVYVPIEKRGILRRKPNFSALSEGMKHELDIAKRLGLEIKYIPHTETSDIPASFQPTWRPLQYEGVESSNDVHLDSSKARKRIYVCTQLRGQGFAELSPAKRRKRLAANVRAAAWYCHQLVKGQGELVAPFAPQAFYPYFWHLLDKEGNQVQRWEAWFERSLGLLTICDAVYFYTADGLPNDSSLSEGMKRIKDAADGLGIEVQYRKAIAIPETWNPAVPTF
ncbi:MAG: hypothetical protein ACJ74J_05400 [Blastocatellia bacterium]